MKAIHRIFKRFGFVHESEVIKLKKESIAAQMRLIKERNDIESLKVDDIVNAIRTVDMVKAYLEEENDILLAQHGQVLSTQVRTRPAPRQNWYQLNIRLDFGKLQRIYEDVQFAHNSMEYDMFLSGILHEVKQNVGALIRINQ